MSTQGIIIIDLIGLGLLLLILNLVRTKKLHVGYAVIWFLATVALMVLVSIPQLLELLPKLFGAIFPASILSLLAFVFIFLVLILFSVQMSTISARQARIIQAIALEELLSQEDKDDSNRNQAE